MLTTFLPPCPLFFRPSNSAFRNLCTMTKILASCHSLLGLGLNFLPTFYQDCWQNLSRHQPFLLWYAHQHVLCTLPCSISASIGNCLLTKSPWTLLQVSLHFVSWSTPSFTNENTLLPTSYPWKWPPFHFSRTWIPSSSSNLIKTFAPSSLNILNIFTGLSMNHQTDTYHQLPEILYFISNASQTKRFMVHSSRTIEWVYLVD